MPKERDNIAQAIAAWSTMLGADLVDARPEAIDRAARTTAPTGHAPCCILRPRSRDDVAAAIHIANQFLIPVHPIARGKNWGYGDACPPVSPCALLDLSGMNRIIELNAEFGYAVVEPGVSQGQLYEAITKQAPNFWMDATGAGPDASVLGNALQRGFGHTLYADHVRSLCGMEVVLPSGDVLNTGFGRFPNAKAIRQFPYGLGPLLDGMFTQSNLGVVTAMGLWLQPRPADFRFFWIKVKDPAALAPLVNALRPLRLQGYLRSALHIGNDLRVISAARPYPWAEANNQTPLPTDLRTALRTDIGCGDWNVSGSLVGSPAEVAEGMRNLRQAVAGLGRVIFLNDTRLSLLKRASSLCARLNLAPGLRQAIQALEENYSLLQGRPNYGPLRGMLWRVRQPLAAPVHDLLDSHAGLLWAAPVLPLRGEDAALLLELATPILARHHFDPLVTFTMLNERAMVAIFNISFDKTLSEEARVAAECQGELKAAFAAAGYYPYRESSLGHATWWHDGDPTLATLQAIKRTLDPNGILSPGLYIPPAS